MLSWSAEVNWASEWGNVAWLLVTDRLVWVFQKVLTYFSHTTISRVYRERSEKVKISSEQQFCGRKCLIDSRGQRRMARLVWADGKATVTEISTRSSRDLLKSISEHTTRRTLKQMSYSSGRTHRVLLLSAKNSKLKLQFIQAHQNWTIEDLKKKKKLTGLMSLDFCCNRNGNFCNSDGRVRIWHKLLCTWKHGSILPCINGSGSWWC